MNDRICEQSPSINTFVLKFDSQKAVQVKIYAMIWSSDVSSNLEICGDIRHPRGFVGKIIRKSIFLKV